MTTFKQFLAEAEAGNLQQMLDLYNSDFSDWPLQFPLGRVESRDYSKMQVMKPRSSPRGHSRAGSHLMQRALASQPSWKDVPNRDMSIFATTTPGKGTYAEMNADGDFSYLALIPKDGTVIAMIEDDFNLKEVTFAGRKMKMFEVFTQYTLNDLRYYKEYLDDRQAILSSPSAHDIDGFMNLYNYLLERLDGEHAERLKRTFAPVVEFIEMVKADKLPPEFFGITLTTSNEYRKPPKPHEAWFHADALAIPIKQYEKFYKLVSNQ